MRSLLQVSPCCPLLPVHVLSLWGRCSHCHLKGAGRAVASTTHYHKSDSDGPCAKRHAGGKPGVEVEGRPLTGDPTAPSLSSQPSVPILGPCQAPRGPGSCSDALYIC